MSESGFRDYFKILGVNRGASSSEIKISFRKLARKYHPDVNPGNNEAEERFKEISEAYEVLSDPQKRKRYEQFGKYWDPSSEGVGEGGSAVEFGNFEEFINDLLGRFGSSQSAYTNSDFQGFSNRSTVGYKKSINLDAEFDLKISFSEAFYGSQRSFIVNNEKVEIKIPKGVKSNSKLRVRGKGNFQPGTGKRGDLYIKLQLESHPIWYFESDHLCCDLPVTFDELFLGAVLLILIPDGQVQVTIPPRTPSGQALRLKGKGWPRTNGRSDIIIYLKMKIPSNLSSKEIELLHEMRKWRSEDPRKDWLELASF